MKIIVSPSAKHPSPHYTLSFHSFIVCFWFFLFSFHFVPNASFICVQLENINKWETELQSAKVPSVLYSMSAINDVNEGSNLAFWVCLQWLSLQGLPERGRRRKRNWPPRWIWDPHQVAGKKGDVCVWEIEYIRKKRASYAHTHARCCSWKWCRQQQRQRCLFCLVLLFECLVDHIHFFFAFALHHGLMMLILKGRERRLRWSGVRVVSITRFPRNVAVRLRARLSTEVYVMRLFKLLSNLRFWLMTATNQRFRFWWEIPFDSFDYSPPVKHSAPTETSQMVCRIPQNSRFCFILCRQTEQVS